MKNIFNKINYLEKYISSKKELTIAFHNALKETIKCDHITCGCRQSNFLWVSKGLKIIYIETPKCACSTIKSHLDIHHTQETFVFSYLKLLRKSAGSSDFPVLQEFSNFGPSMGFDEKSYKKTTNIVSSKIGVGDYLTEAVGKYGFSHFFGNAKEVVDRFPDYDIFCVIREPVERFISGYNMFYADFNFRRKQRLSHSMIEDISEATVEEIIQDIGKYKNHHFEKLVNFIDGESIHKNIKFIHVSKVDDFLKNITRKRHQKIIRHNVARGYSISLKDLSSEILSDLHSFYKEDYELLKMI